MSMFFIDPYRTAAAPEPDPYFANVVLLLHAEGTIGTATFTDSSSLGHVPTTVSGTPQLSATQVLTGVSSIKFNSPGTSAADSFVYTVGGGPWAFGTGDFTVEFGFYNQNTVNGNNGVLSARALFADPGWVIDTRTADVIFYHVGSATYCYLPCAQNVWTRLAFSRVAGVMYGFVDGVLTTTVADTSNYTYSSFLYVGRYGWLKSYLKGYLDEVRITKGVGRYTASYTPATAPFPDY